VLPRILSARHESTCASQSISALSADRSAGHWRRQRRADEPEWFGAAPSRRLFVYGSV